MILRLFLLLWIASLAATEPDALYLILPTHPDSEMRIHWLMAGKQPKQTLKFHAINKDEWYVVEAYPQALPKASSYTLFTIQLTELHPQTYYEFVIGDEKKRYTFCTQSSTLDHPLKFVAGGDIFHDSIEVVESMNKVVAQQNPDFVLLGGDLAYASPKITLLSEKEDYWIQFLKTWSQTMVRSNGSLIPMVPTLGNHDVTGRFDQPPEKAAFYYALFSMPGYRTLDFGSYMSLWVLDSSHTHPVEGAQTHWLAESLKLRSQIPHKFALYHVPAYPSVRPFSNPRSQAIRDSWVPLFDEFGLEAAFENHDHAYKRTHPLKNGKKDPDGVLYLGDGAWGVETPRTPHSPKELWYLARSEPLRHVLLVTLDSTKCIYQALNSAGKIFDTFTR